MNEISKRNNHLTKTLGLIQAAILSAINSQPEQAYGSAIASRVSAQMDREIPDGQVYTALLRLEAHGMVETISKSVEPSRRGRGRPRKYYKLTAAGLRALQRAVLVTSVTAPQIQQSSEKGAEHAGNEEAWGRSPSLG